MDQAVDHPIDEKQEDLGVEDYADGIDLRIWRRMVARSVAESGWG
jgi:hypothetical protein